MKLVHWPLMGGLLHLVQRGWVRVPAQAHQQPVYQSPYCCIMVCCSMVLSVPVKGLSNVWSVFLYISRFV